MGAREYALLEYNDAKLHCDAYGVCYGYDLTFDGNEPFIANTMSGWHTIRRGLSLSYIGSGVIPGKNRF